MFYIIGIYEKRDFVEGDMSCVLEILFTLMERMNFGQGQVVNIFMVDGAVYLSNFILKMKQRGLWNASHGENLVDFEAPFYNVYQTKDSISMIV